MRLLLPVCHILPPYSKLCPVSGILIDSSVSYSVNSHSSLESSRLLKFYFFLRYQMPNSTARTVQDFCFVSCVVVSDGSFYRPEHVLQFKHYILQISNQVTCRSNTWKFNLPCGLSNCKYGGFRPCSVFILGGYHFRFLMGYLYIYMYFCNQPMKPV